MQTVHLSNHHFDLHSPYAKVVGFVAIVATLFLVILSPSWPQALISLFAMGSLCGLGYWLIRKSWVGYTLTPTHFQQHLFHGGWVVKWSNISHIGICSYEQEGWYQPLPWIGIKLKQYEPYLDGICPRIATEILLSQRALLYLGARQKNQESSFEDMVLDSQPFCEQRKGKVYKGLMAMLANRMRYQRQYYDYDVFISANDLDRSAEEFVGLARRYLAAAEPESDQ
ncbi:DUF2982 domain-containing protein [Vibrio fluvialis]|jgi:hypothetical protein|uniref:DUF2982 domain-containing protein n=1 Tax=Vibrio fluvialis TaxID=676 RepID=A0AAX2LSD9_VIBFL|nr:MULTISPECIES: DUF2982 domain-containing protein [Vibrio]AMF94352.1 DUF2982 domain-containing protein [Vibrio fluvialis]EKO3367441.1 DUF2982 domain-containing protein [Vibrio fluvialis]EKO3377417.1 DUF2982 domain-containing protein [Vibrio fluvialis]EKO3381140.1 DUF2982 domain-containing protein [Vibrio fluvialis]EKO3389420.1 DUF2982 domain-containing protein [Vibrio fluvialis]